MSDEYQLRKDIDRLIRDVYDLNSGALRLTTTDEFDKLVDRLNSDNSLDVLEANLSTFSESLDGYVDSLESFEEQLDEYGDDLTEFGGQLTDYGGQLTTFSGQLSSYGGQLSNFNGQLTSYGTQLNTFNGQLTSYGTQLTGFGNQLTGFSGDLTTFNGKLTQYKAQVDALDDALNDESTGFITTLSTLKTYIYGYDPNNPSAHSYNNPTSDSLKGMTNTLQQLIHDLQTGDGIVLENLGRLKDHIQAFSGNLQQFKTYLAQQGVDVSTLNDDVISLILELNKSLDTISEHQDMLEEAQEIIGEPSTQSTQATGIFKRLEDGEEVMENVSTQADAIDVIVRGDPQVTGDTGLQGLTSDLQTTIGDANSGLIKDTNTLKTTVGDSSSGLIKDTNALKTTVGNSSSGLVKDTNALKTTVGDSNSGLIKDTNTLKTTVGDNNSGLIKDTNALKTTVGDSNSGLVKKTNDLDDAVGDENTGLIAQTNDIIDTIGEPAQGQQSATGLHLLIDNAQETADAVDGVATLIKEKIGYNSIPDENPLQSQITTQGGTISSQGSRLTSAEGTISSQGSRLTSAEGTITAHGGRLTTVEGQISTLDGQYSSVSSAVSDITNTELPRLDGALDTLGEFATALAYSLSQILKPTSDYTEIYYCSGVPDTQDLLIWEADYGYDTSNIMYAINQTGTGYVRNGSSWATGTIPSSITKKIGVIGYFDERPQEGFNPSFDYIYSVSTTEYFKLSSQ